MIEHSARRVQRGDAEDKEWLHSFIDALSVGWVLGTRRGVGLETGFVDDSMSDPSDE